MSRHLDARIAIIGAGPAGLAAAWYLKERGYRDVHVLEKQGRVGGMCESITEGYRCFDLGGNYITPAYKETLALARQVGAEMFTAKKYHPVRVEEDEDGEHRLEDLELTDFILTDPTNPDRRIPIWKLAVGVLRFGWLRFKVRRFVGGPTFARVHERPDLCVSFDKWLADNDLAYLGNVFQIPMPMMGYGLLNEIGAPYALMYMAPGTFATMFLRRLPIIKLFARWPKRFAQGFQRMWQLLSWGLNVRMNVTVTRITRGPGTYRPIEIELEHPDRIFHGTMDRQEKLFFDRLILACPLTPDVLRGMQTDLRQDETDLFSKIQNYSFCQTTLHAFQEVDGKEQTFRLKAPVVPVLPFNRASTGRPWVVVQLFEDSPLLQFYTRIDPDDWDRTVRAVDPTGSDDDPARKIVLDRVERLLGLMGGHRAGTRDPRRERAVNFRRWPYFGHVDSGEMRAGFFKDLDDLQGRYNTYYAGGGTTFELIESVVRSAKYAVGKLDADLREDPAFASRAP